MSVLKDGLPIPSEINPFGPLFSWWPHVVAPTRVFATKSMFGAWGSWNTHTWTVGTCWEDGQDMTRRNMSSCFHQPKYMEHTIQKGHRSKTQARMHAWILDLPGAPSYIGSFRLVCAVDFSAARCFGFRHVLAFRRANCHAGFVFLF